MILRSIRYHHWSCGRSARHGICSAGGPETSVWTVLIFHGRSGLLVLRNFQGYHHRRKFMKLIRQGRILTL